MAHLALEPHLLCKCQLLNLSLEDVLPGFLPFAGRVMGRRADFHDGWALMIIYHYNRALPRMVTYHLIHLYQAPPTGRLTSQYKKILGGLLILLTNGLLGLYLTQ